MFVDKRLTAVCSVSLLAGGLFVASQATAQNSVSFETEGDVVETKSLGGHSCDSQALLERVTLNFQASAVDSEILDTGIRGLGVENRDPVSGGEVESCNELVTLSLAVVGGPSNAGLSLAPQEVCLTRNLDRFDGTTDFNGASGANQPNATNISDSSSVVITGSDLAFFTSSGFDVRFEFDARGSGSNETADAAFANGLDGSGRVSVAYSCEDPVCALDPDLSADDPLCVPCQFVSGILASDPACVPPKAVPGMTFTGLLASLLGLPLIAVFFARRWRRT